MISARVLGLHVVKSSAGEELVACPFHNDNSPSAWFSPKKGLFYCSVCGFGLNLQQLKDKLSLDIDLDELEDSAEIGEIELSTEKIILPEGDTAWHDYFERRGISPLIATHYNISWKSGRPEAAVLPITNVMGMQTGVVLRFQNPKEAGTRYKVIGETQPLWPMEMLRGRSEGGVVIVTEGAWSAMRLATFYTEEMTVYVTPLALLGAKANQRIVDALRPFKPIFLYDNDEAGRRACRKMRELFPLALSHTLSTAPDDRDDEQMEQLVLSIEKRIKDAW